MSAPDARESAGAAFVADEGADGPEEAAPAPLSAAEAARERIIGFNRDGTSHSVVRRTYDWPAIRMLYVEGEGQADGSPRLWPSLSAVAERFGVVPQRVRERSREEGWVDQRARFQAQLESIRQVERAKRLAEDGSKLEADVIRAARMGINLATARLQEIALAQQERTRTGAAARNNGGHLSAKELDALARTVDQFHRVGLRALGLAETTTRVEQTGAAGGPIDLSLELRRDDPRRLVDVLGLLGGLGLADVVAGSLAGGADEGAAGDDEG